ncbi:hypothetical protein C1645_738567 [Glomus cerebriforme]|uniref:Galactose oxidase n=1 Tax=Glomus cerebriforme TaxID=658196 RepID=A0A397T0H1_9GLOM|nr:hypothetical protein C1645_738567 [Glomus cerebriforme]
MTSFYPSKRYLHTATYVDNKLYILSGIDTLVGTITAGKQFFYLDVSVPFSTQSLLWHDLTSLNIIPSHIGAASVKGGANNNTIILYGGRNLTNIDNMALVYMFDTQTNSWNIPSIAGVSYPRRRSLTAITDYNGKIYLFGGYLVVDNTFVNDMLILDTINLSWGKGSSLNAPVPRINYGAVILPNKNIIYIGGMSGQNESLPLNEVYMYDTVNDSWNTKTTSGSIPSNRDGLSAILGLDGQQIIIFGGKQSGTTGNIILNDSLYTLNINTFEWNIPNISGEIPRARSYHKANVIGKYMVISYGSGYDQYTDSDILLLDISNNNNYIWTTVFDSSVSMPSPSSQPSNNINSSNITPAAMADAIVGSLFGGILLSFGVFFLYKWNKNKQKQNHVIQIHGNSNSY